MTTAPEAVGDAVVGRIGREIRAGGCFRVFSRPPVHCFDIAREVVDFSSFTGFAVNGRFFGKSAVITRW
jgi:hypothetical protein